MNKIVQEIKDEVTVADMEKLAKVEALWELKKLIQNDQNTALELLGEIVENRRETCHTLGVEIGPLDEILEGLDNAFKSVKKNIAHAQHSSIKTD